MIVDLKTARIVIWILVVINLFQIFIIIDQNREIQAWSRIARASIKHELELMQDMNTLEQDLQKVMDICSGK